MRALPPLLMVVAFVFAANSASAEAPPWTDHLTLSISDRLRVEGVSWFRPGSPAIGGEAHRYTFGANRLRVGARLTFPSWQAYVELQDTRLFGLPDNASVGSPFGNLGPGALYYSQTASRDQGGVFIRQGFLTLRRSGASLTGGRFEYKDGLESVPGDRTVSWLKSARIAERLIGPFGYTHVGRTFDALRLSLDRPTWNLTAFGGRPTQGGFETSANRGVEDLWVGVASATWKRPPLPFPADLRAFYMYYRDGRDRPTIVDNRAAAMRVSDDGNIEIHTGGGHALAAIDAGPGAFDLLGWFAVQGGAWGRLDHSAWSYAFEAGYRAARLPGAPWLRVGWNHSSGDDDPNDSKHETFFQALPTARLYARLPFFNLMNSSDLFAQLILDPHRRVRIRIDYHWLQLTERADLWYAGGGATNDRVFGFAGASSGGERELAHLLDIGVSIGPVWPIEDSRFRASLSLYYGHAFGEEVIENRFADADADYGYAEITLSY